MPMPRKRWWKRKPGLAKPIRSTAWCRENVIAQLNNIKTHPSVAVGLRDHTLRLHGWFYDIETGDIQALDKNTKSFVSLSENPDVFFE